MKTACYIMTRNLLTSVHRSSARAVIALFLMGCVVGPDEVPEEEEWMPNSCTLNNGGELFICNEYTGLDWEDSDAEEHCSNSVQNGSFHFGQSCDTTQNLGVCIVGDCWTGFIQFYYGNAQEFCGDALTQCEHSEGLFLPGEECSTYLSSQPDQE